MRLTIITPTCRDYSFLLVLGESLRKYIPYHEYNWIVIYNSVSQAFYIEQKKLLQAHFSTNSPQILFCSHPGKSSSVHLGTSLVNTEYFTVINDKDILLMNPLKNVPSDYQLPSSVIGFCFPIKTISSKISFSESFTSSLINAYLSRKITGDHLVVYRTKFSLKYFFPPLFNESFMPEDVIHLLAHQDLNTYLFIPQYSISREYLIDGLTRNYSKALKSSPYSSLLYLYLTLKNINSLNNVRFFKVSLKIIFYLLETLRRPYLTTFSLVVMLLIILPSYFFFKLFTKLISLIK